ncbi:MULTISPECIES: flagellar protein FliT [unclassified Virgibacillus]|uniref:flagellar protein FliT n=1 Tax=unclassified Virgibacillus TaxID=2620237 RepID=UPI0024DECA6D|nr:flagellar protein FliT [Virgibacillus sp. LDC-1]
MSSVKQVYDVTLELKQVLDQHITAKNRPAVIEEVNALIEKRGMMMEMIQHPFSDEDQRIGQELIQLNNLIQQQMQILFDALKSEMKQVKKQKKSNHSYINPYSSVQSFDGMFMDKKK